MIEVDRDLCEAIYSNAGGIGNIYISKCRTRAFKVTFNVSAFINNVKWGTTLIDVLPCTRLLNYFSFSTADGHLCVRTHMRTLETLLKKDKYLNDSIGNIDNWRIYSLIYETYDCNAFGFLLNAPREIADTTMPVLLAWAGACIVAMHNLGVFHNDFKLDNILLRRKFVPTIVRLGEFIIENKTDFEFFINDFDMTMHKKVFCDIEAIKNSLFRMASLRLYETNILGGTVFDNVNDIQNLIDNLYTRASENLKSQICICMF